MVKTMNIIEIFSKNVKKYRKSLNMTQSELAQLTGLHRTYICAVEKEKRNISLDNIQKISEALGVEIYLLFKMDTK